MADLDPGLRMRQSVSMLPADGHVHSEWSWDARDGSMDRTCARAVELGLPAIAFTEHVDHTAWHVLDRHLPENAFLGSLADADGLLTPQPFDVEGYLECLERCRATYPDLRIISGVELGEPHLHRAAAERLLATGSFERALGSLHCLPVEGGYAGPPELLRAGEPAEVVRAYLAEIPRVVAEGAAFGVLAHIDYPVRYWPREAGPFRPRDFEEEFRHALRAIAAGGRLLEVNTAVPLSPMILQWWGDVGGRAITFGSDAHEPWRLARGLREAAAMAEGFGYRPGRHPFDVWYR